MSFDVEDLQALQETEPSGTEALRLTNCFKHLFCTDN
ncbi:ALQxL family class IV lanthipeptide [Planobispora takensis]|nr:ALQxL family class IV lanthipeptide [Planobispora takensis]